ncbi:bHLH123 protein [Hibiscus syriacus]|uniref:BHLH123 protein n=1 Tax=Hibiscus syriacus TaxID=106335 RepID=A0A6A3CNH4_HIBSY|nr:bHLH123 protein [Hibiscus syriacus]
MAEEFYAGICGETWWNPTKTMFTGCNSPLYTTGIADIGSFGWGTDPAEIKARTNVSVFHHKPDQLQAGSDQNGGSSVLIDSTLQMMGFGFSSSTTSDWNKYLLLSSGEDSSINSCQGLSASYDCPSTLIQTLFEADPQVPQQQSLFNNQSINYMSSTAAYGAPSIRSPPLTKQPAGNLQFSNNTSFWNPSATATGINDVKPGFSPSPPFEEKPNCLSLTTETNIDGIRNRKNSGSVMKKGSCTETPLKRPRLETPSPLPTFKVRKEKLGDRITALQQLVSPFGKTDTASVLHEAIEYIKILHDQVNVLTTPYMKQAAAPMQQQSSDKLKDLRSRGLCLVPVSSTFPVATETPVDFWTPTFGATFG